MPFASNLLLRTANIKRLHQSIEGHFAQLVVFKQSCPRNFAAARTAVANRQGLVRVETRQQRRHAERLPASHEAHARSRLNMMPNGRVSECRLRTSGSTRVHPASRHRHRSHFLICLLIATMRQPRTGSSPDFLPFPPARHRSVFS